MSINYKNVYILKDGVLENSGDESIYDEIKLSLIFIDDSMLKIGVNAHFSHNLNTI